MTKTTTQRPKGLEQVGSTYRDFRVTKSLEIKELQCHLTELIHEGSGAQVLHLGNDDPENLFNLSFRTRPSSSNGVAHILEHTVLCGSEKYPVKDPFFAMTRRSLNTFMNALTGSDFTCYPAASQVPKDFYNLLEVYLDAVFAPKLDERSFRQEGHRLEFSKHEDPSSPLEYKGIVFNEMKGGMASPTSRLYDAIGKALYPDLTYGFNSGGDPKVIPELTYSEFKKFHQTYYHPGHCLFFFYGDLPLEKHLDFIWTHTLSKTEAVADLEPIPRQPRFTAPKTVSERYPIAPDEDPADKDYISFAWLTCHVLEQDELLALNIIDSILMDTDASPLRLSLLKTGLCKQASSSIDNDVSEVPLIITLRGCSGAHAEALEEAMRNELTRLADEGIPQHLVDSAIHQMEFQRSEITGDGAPFGLALFWRSALLKQLAGDSEQGLVIHSLFDTLRKKMKEQPDYLSMLIRKHFLDNQHFVRLVMTPDQQLTQQEEADERAKLDAIQSKLGEIDQQILVDSAIELQKFQDAQEHQDLSCLPKLALSDIPQKARDFSLESEAHGPLTVHRHSCFTNGIVYGDLVWDLPYLKESELPYARLLTSMVSQLGCGGRNYRQNLEFLHENTGGVGAALGITIQADDRNQFTPCLHVKGKALFRKRDKLFSVLQDVVNGVDLSDKERVREILLKHHTSLQASVTNQSMHYALSLSAQGLDLPSRLSEAWYGVEYLFMIRELIENLDTRFEGLISTLSELRDRLFNPTNPQLVIACSDNEYQALVSEEFYGMKELSITDAKKWAPDFTKGSPYKHARPIGAPVAFTGQSMATAGYTDPDTPALSLASSLFQNRTLHTLVREKGGAYGAGASNSVMSGHFYFYAYRDPNLSKTLAAFRAAVDDITSGSATEEDLEEAKLEIIQNADAPIAPGSRAGLAYGWLAAGKTLEKRQAFRDRLLGTTLDEVKKAVERHIAPQLETATTVVFAGKELLERENNLLSNPFPLERI